MSQSARPLLVLALGLLACSDERAPVGDAGAAGPADTETGDGDGDGDEHEKFDVPEDSGSTGGDEQGGCHNVDLLFVIDDSGSMKDEQENLVASFDGFIGGIQEQLAQQDFHVGVISTDAYAGNPADCRQLGALVTATTGAGSSESTCGPFAAGQRFMTQADDLAQAFTCTARIGIEGDGDEKPMEAIARALDPDAAGVADCNQAFLRDDAILVIVLISDEEDDHEGSGCPGNPFAQNEGSPGDPPIWFDRIVAAKQGREQSVVLLSLIGPTGPDPGVCPWLDKCGDAIQGAEPGKRLIALTEMFTHGVLGRVCEQDYDAFFASAIGPIVEACEQFPPEG